MTSVFFYPHLGGIETITEILAMEFCKIGGGIEVKIVTNTTEIGTKTFPFEVYRNPDRKTLWRLYKWCDVFVHQGISLKLVWPWLIKRKPWFIVYHSPQFQKGYLGRIKKFCSHLTARNIAVSEDVRRGCGLTNCVTILNTYNKQVYKRTNVKERRDIAFVGKMFRDKGVYMLLDVFERFKNETGSDYTLTMIGDGSMHPEAFEEVKEYAAKLKHVDDIHFMGALYPEDIAPILNKAKILVVPSLYNEAFGIVCLEGMASGCVVIGSDGDGIAEAINGHGYTFRKGDSNELYDKIKIAAMSTQEEINARWQETADWLEEVSPSNVAKKYIDEFSCYMIKQ